MACLGLLGVGVVIVSQSFVRVFRGGRGGWAGGLDTAGVRAEGRGERASAAAQEQGHHDADVYQSPYHRVSPCRCNYHTI